jgi:hypothetical protein
MGELLGRRVVAVQSTPARTDSQETVPILRERHDKVRAQTVFVAWIVPVDPELVAIIAIKPIERPEPHKALTVTNDTQCPVV